MNTSVGIGTESLTTRVHQIESLRRSAIGQNEGNRTDVRSEGHKAMDQNLNGDFTCRNIFIFEDSERFE